MFTFIWCLVSPYINIHTYVQTYVYVCTYILPYIYIYCLFCSFAKKLYLKHSRCNSKYGPKLNAPATAQQQRALGQPHAWQIIYIFKSRPPLNSRLQTYWICTVTYVDMYANACMHVHMHICMYVCMPKRHTYLREFTFMEK